MHYGITLFVLKAVITLKILMISFNDKCEKIVTMINHTISFYIEISANTNTLKSEIILKDKYEVYFWQYNFINSLLGFHSNLHKSAFHESENMVNILTINSILVNIDIVSGSYVNGSTQPTIYSFFPNVSWV